MFLSSVAYQSAEGTAYGFLPPVAVGIITSVVIVLVLVLY